MKLKKIFIMFFIILFSTSYHVNADEYTYSYSLENIDYDENGVEVEIMFSSYGEAVDINAVCYAAIYDNEKNQLSDLSVYEYFFENAFQNEECFSVKQVIQEELSSGKEYTISVFLFEKDNFLKPAAHTEKNSVIKLISNGSNQMGVTDTGNVSTDGSNRTEVGGIVNAEDTDEIINVEDLEISTPDIDINVGDAFVYEISDDGEVIGVYSNNK